MAGLTDGGTIEPPATPRYGLQTPWDRVSAAAGPGERWPPAPALVAADAYEKRFHGGDYTPVVRVGAGWTIAQLTAAMSSQQGIDPRLVRLVCHAMFLQPEFTQEDYGLGREHTLHIVVKFPQRHPPAPTGWNAAAVALFRGDLPAFEELARRSLWRPGWWRRRTAVVAAAAMEAGLW
jgi:hypothetical protein